MDRSDWLDLRRTGVGGSDIAALVWPHLPSATVLGERPPFKSRMQVYLDKTGQLDEEAPSEYLRDGSDLEPHVAARLREWAHEHEPTLSFDDEPPQTKLVERERKGRYLPMIVSLDRFGRLGEEPVGIELKTTNPHSFEAWEYGVPLSYRCQVQWYMEGLSLPRFYVACWSYGRPLSVHVVEHDAAFCNQLLDAAVDFWHDHILADSPPPYDGSKSDTLRLAELYPQATNTEVVALDSDKAVELVDDYRTCSEQVEFWGEQLEGVKNRLRALLGDAAYGRVGEYLVSYSNVSQRRVDTDLLKTRYPDVYKATLREKTYRRWGGIRRVAV